MLHQIWSFLTATHAEPVFAIAPLLLAGIMALAGAAKGATVDKDKENRQRKLEAETTRYSPWTHMTGQAPTEADPFGNALQGGFTGLSLGQGMENQNAYNEYLKKGSPWTVMPGNNTPANVGMAPQRFS